MRLRGFGSGAAFVTLLFTYGCGGSPEPTAQGGLNLHIASSPSPPAGKICSIPSHYALLGSEAPTATDKGKPVVDGEGGSVSCTANGSSTVKFRGTITKGAVGFAVSDGVVEKGGTGTALIQVADDKGTLETPSDTPCEVDVSFGDLRAGEGTLWAALKCPALINRDQPSVFCEAPDGFVILQNCD